MIEHIALKNAIIKAPTSGKWVRLMKGGNTAIPIATTSQLKDIYTNTPQGKQYIKLVGGDAVEVKVKIPKPIKAREFGEAKKAKKA